MCGSRNEPLILSARSQMRRSSRCSSVKPVPGKAVTHARLLLLLWSAAPMKSGVRLRKGGKFRAATHGKQRRAIGAWEIDDSESV